MTLFTLRDGQNRIVGTTTTNSNGDAVARDRSGSILGGQARPSTTPATHPVASPASTLPPRDSCPVGKP
jgi:hypothetical protein